MGSQLASHLREAQVEDVLFLIESGASRKDACARVGISVDVFEKHVERKS